MSIELANNTPSLQDTMEGTEKLIHAEVATLEQRMFDMNLDDRITFLSAYAAGINKKVMMSYEGSSEAAVKKQIALLMVKNSACSILNTAYMMQTALEKEAEEAASKENKDDA